MGDVLTPNPYEPGSEEDRLQREAQLRGAGLAVTNLLPGMVAQVLPYRTDEQGQTHIQLPLTGAATAAYGGAGVLGPMALNYAAGKLGIHGRLGSLPGAEGALQVYEDTSRAARNLVPHMEAQSPEEKVIEDMAFSGGGMALPGAGLISGLPKYAATAAHTIVPTASATMAAPIIGAGAAGGLEILNQKKQDDLYREMGFDPAQVRLGQVDLSKPDTTATVSHPETGAPANLPFPTSSTQTTTAPPQSVLNINDIHVPPYGIEGETDLPWWEVALGLGAAALSGHVTLKYGGKLFDPAYKFVTGATDQLDTAANRAAHNANLDTLDRGQAVAAQGAPNVSGAARGEAPLPGKAGTVGTRLAQAAWDKTRTLTALNEATAPSKTIAERLSADIGTTNGGSGLYNRIDEQMGTGVNDATGHQIPKLKEIVQDYDRLTPDQQAKLDTGLHAGDELDSRKIQTQQRQAAGLPFADEDIRHNFRDVHTNDLETRYNAMMADAETRAVANRLYALDGAGMAEGVAQGRLTVQDAQRILKQRPRHIPSVDVEGSLKGLLQERDLTQPGYQTPNGRAIDAIVQHYGKLYEEYARNTVNDKIIKQVEQWQAADPSRARIFNKTKPFDGEGRPITVYRDGVPHTYQVDNTQVWRALKDNVGKTNLFWNTSDVLRRSMQSGTTGIAATAFGRRPYGMINLLRNIPQIAVDRRPGTSFGAIDRGVQRMTGGPGYRGPDPSQYVGSFAEAGRGAYNVTARNIADILRANTPVSKAMRVMKGDAWVDALAQRMQNRYDATNIPGGLAERRMMGVGGSGAGGAADRPVFNVNLSNKTGYNPLADAVPGAFRGRVRIPGYNGVTQTYINLRTVLRDIHQEISDGANSYYYRQMRQDPNLTKTQAAFEARRVIGDPSMTGASPYAQGFGRSIPYFNPSLQDAVRAARNLRDNPVAFILGTVHTLSVAASASLLSAMLGGSKHLNMLGQLMGAHDRASNVTFFHDPTNEHNYTQISLPQRWRMIYPMIQEMLAYGTGAFQAREGEPLFNRVIHSLADMFTQHMSVGTRSAAIQGASDFADIVQAPQQLQTLAGLGGVKVQPPIGAIAQDVIEDKPWLSGIVTGKTGTSRLPAQQANSSVLSNDDNTWMRNLMGNIAGVAGQAIYDDVTHMIDRFSVNHSFADAIDGLVGDAGQSWRDNASFGNMIWGNNVKLTAHNPMGDNVELALQKLNPKVFPAAKDMQLAGLTREGGAAVIQNGAPKVSDDPTIRQMVVLINENYTKLSQTLVPQLQDIKQQIRALDQDSYYSAEDKRTMHNQMTGKLNDKYEQIDRQIKLLNAGLSTLAGGKHVDVRSFEPARDMSQFHD